MVQINQQKIQEFLTFTTRTRIVEDIETELEKLQYRCQERTMNGRTSATAWERTEQSRMLGKSWTVKNDQETSD